MVQARRKAAMEGFFTSPTETRWTNITAFVGQLMEAMQVYLV